MTEWMYTVDYLLAGALLVMMAIGIAASKTCPTFSPRYAAAAEKMIVMMIPKVTDQTVTSG